MVVAGSLLLGIAVANEMKQRLAQLRDIERILGYLVGEISYKHALLHEACRSVSERCGQPFSRWLIYLSEKLNTNYEINADEQEMDYQGEWEKTANGYTYKLATEEKTVSAIWSSSLERLHGMSHLRASDISILEPIGSTLGYLNINSQQLSIDLEREHIHKHISNLDKDLNNCMKLSVTMGMLGGILAVIIFA